MDSAAMQRVQAQFESMLMQPLLEPIESALGGYGEIAMQSFGDALAKAMSPR